MMKKLQDNYPKILKLFKIIEITQKLSGKLIFFKLIFI